MTNPGTANATNYKTRLTATLESEKQANVVDTMTAHCCNSYTFRYRDFFYHP